MTTDTSALGQVGRATTQPRSPDEARLERVPNPQADVLYLARFTAPEFTSLCPVTGQPDFAHLVIDYAPGDWLIESKSLKLFLTSFRDHGSFHEDCTVKIGRRIVETAQPKWLRIGGYWYPPAKAGIQAGRAEGSRALPHSSALGSRPPPGRAEEGSRKLERPPLSGRPLRRSAFRADHWAAAFPPRPAVSTFTPGPMVELSAIFFT